MRQARAWLVARPLTSETSSCRFAFESSLAETGSFLTRSISSKKSASTLSMLASGRTLARAMKTPASFISQ